MSTSHTWNFRRHAFSLVEMLVVMGIIGLLLVLAVPALRNLAGARGIVKAVNGTYGILEYARNEAQTRETYVWVGFGNGSNISSGNLEARAIVLASVDGTPTNITTTNLTNISKMERFDSVQYITSGSPNGTNVMSSSSILNYTYAGSGGGNKFTNFVVFSPAGQVILPTGTVSASSPYSDLTTVVLAATKAGQQPSGKYSYGVIDISGGTGSIRLEPITNIP